MDVDVGYVHQKDRPGYRLETEDQIRNYVLAQVADVEVRRQRCDVPGAEMDEVLAREQRRRHREFQMWYGHAIGGVVMAHRTGSIGDICYNELLTRLNQTLQPTLIG